MVVASIVYTFAVASLSARLTRCDGSDECAAGYLEYSTAALCNAGLA